MGILSVCLFWGGGAVVEHIFYSCKPSRKTWCAAYELEKAFSKRKEKKKKTFGAKMNHELALNLQNSFCFACWLVCSLLFYNKNNSKKAELQ